MCLPVWFNTWCVGILESCFPIATFENQVLKKDSLCIISVAYNIPAALLHRRPVSTPLSAVHALPQQCQPAHRPLCLQRYHETAGTRPLIPPPDCGGLPLPMPAPGKVHPRPPRRLLCHTVGLATATTDHELVDEVRHAG